MPTTDVLREPMTGSCAWQGGVLSRSDDWIYRLSDAEIAELDTAMRAGLARGIPLLDVTREDFPLPTLTPVLEQMTDELENGRGFVLVKGLPADRYSEVQASRMYWGLGQHLGMPVSQNAAGDLLGHVRDTGRSIRDPSVRGYQTKVRLPYHTDGSDVVGLLCFRPARSGGLSTIVSSSAVYNEVLRRRPDLVDRMYEPFYFDRREEHREGEDPFYATPLVTFYEGKLSMRYIRGFIESAQRHAAVPRLTDQDIELFDLIDQIANAEEFRLDMDFEVGDMQFLNNYVIMHSRTNYEDFEEHAHKRHLLRLWLTLRQGRALPESFARGSASTNGSGGRGGVPPRVPLNV